MRNEDGLNAGFRNVGRFFLSLVPWAFAIGIMAWIGVWVALDQYNQRVSQERRRASYVGAEEKPKEKLIIDVVPVDCLHVTRADTDGDKLTIYARNDCKDRGVDYTAYHWQAISPDGTILAQNYTNLCPVPSRYGDKAECQMEVSTDDRTKSLRIWVKDRP